MDELTEQVLNDLQENLGYSYTQAYNSLYSGGLSIFTTQDPHIQSICDEQFANEENYPPNTRYYLKYEASYTDSENDAVNFSTQYFEKHFKEKRGNGFNCIFNTEEEAYEAIEEFKQDVEEPGYKFITESISLTPQPQASVTIIDQYTGEVKAIVGGRGEKKASLHLTVQRIQSVSPDRALRYLRLTPRQLMRQASRLHQPRWMNLTATPTDVPSRTGTADTKEYVRTDTVSSSP